jgi:hypothetical protein
MAYDPSLLVWSYDIIVETSQGFKICAGTIDHYSNGSESATEEHKMAEF